MATFGIKAQRRPRPLGIPDTRRGRGPGAGCCLQVLCPPACARGQPSQPKQGLEGSLHAWREGTRVGRKAPLRLPHAAPAHDSAARPHATAACSLPPHARPLGSSRRRPAPCAVHTTSHHAALPSTTLRQARTPKRLHERQGNPAYARSWAWHTPTPGLTHPGTGGGSNCCAPTQRRARRCGQLQAALRHARSVGRVRVGAAAAVAAAGPAPRSACG